LNKRSSNIKMGRRVFRHKVRRVPPGFSFTVDMPKVPDKVSILWIS